MKKRQRRNAAYRFLTLSLCLTLTTGMTLPALAADMSIAARSSQPIYVNNTYIEMTMYNIGGNNYVRLRDIGAAVDFGVYYDETNNTVHITSNEPYFGGASAIGPAPETAEITPSTQPIYVDGVRVDMAAYMIGGNNYVKLRDVGLAVDFSVVWDPANNRVLVDTSKPYTPEGSPEVEPRMTIDEMKAEIIRLTNLERVKAGVPELEVLPALMDCAQAKAQDFLNSNYYGHNSPVYGAPGEMMRAFVPNSKGWGENIAPWRETLQEVFDEWMNSPGHRDNILEPRYTHIGIGIVKGADGGYWWVQQFVAI